MINPTNHERSEWSRMATDAYATGRNFYGHRYSAACAIFTGPVTESVYDSLMFTYRDWLVNGWRNIDPRA